MRREKWECVRGMDKSFGYDRASRAEDLPSREQLLHGLVDVVSKNGNLLLNVGPRGEAAAIPEPQRTRLAWLESFIDLRIALDAADADEPVRALVLRGIAPDAAQPGGA